MERVVTTDDQPISATFFGEGKWLSEFITPDALEIRKLYLDLTRGVNSRESKIAACHQWVASEVKYKSIITGRLWVEGKSSVQRDLWMDPSMTKTVRVGNCANKSFLLTSLLRNELPPQAVHCVLGNLHNHNEGGHAWCLVRLGERDFVVEPTRSDVEALVPAFAASRYEAVHLFNDKESFVIEGRTVLEPFSACYSTWLKDYLDYAYIEGRK